MTVTGIPWITKCRAVYEFYLRFDERNFLQSCFTYQKGKGSTLQDTWKMLAEGDDWLMISRGFCTASAAASSRAGDVSSSWSSVPGKASLSLTGHCCYSKTNMYWSHEPQSLVIDVPASGVFLMFISSEGMRRELWGSDVNDSCGNSQPEHCLDRLIDVVLMSNRWLMGGWGR